MASICLSPLSMGGLLCCLVVKKAGALSTIFVCERLVVESWQNRPGSCFTPYHTWHLRSNFRLRGLYTCPGYGYTQSLLDIALTTPGYNYHLAGLVGRFLSSHPMFPILMSCFQRFLYQLSHWLTRLWWRGSVDRKLPLKPGQGAVIVTNHRSSVDPFFIQLAVGPRLVHWMVAKEFVNLPAFHWFLRLAEVIPTNRGGIDTAATKQAIRYAAAGSLVGLLPEGRINTGKDFLLPVRPGAALVAIRANVPLIPCFIEGAPYRKTVHSPFLMRARVRVHIGVPFEMASYRQQANEREAAVQLTRDAMRAIAVLAGQTDFEPTLAGRRWKPNPEELAEEAVHNDR